MSVEYRQIPGCSRYIVGSDGSMWSNVRLARRPLLPDCRNEDGRKRYTIFTDDGRRIRKYGSYFVLITFVGPKPEGMEACHSDGNCLNDSKDNLRWGTPVENKRDMIAHGTRMKGEQINTAKLTEADVREIRRIGRPLKPLALRFGITESMVSSILNRKSWAHVE